MLFLDKLQQREGTISELLEYIRSTSGEALHGYTGHDVHYILQMLHDHQRWERHNTTGSSTSSRAPTSGHGVTGSHPSHQTSDVINSDFAKSRESRDLPKRGHRQTVWSAHDQKPSASAYDTPPGGNIMHGKRGSQESHDSPAIVHNAPNNHLSQTSSYMQSKEHSEISNHEPSLAQQALPSKHMQSYYDSGQYYVGQSRISANLSTYDCPECIERHRVFHENDKVVHNPVAHEEHDTLHEVAHGLHFASIALLGFLVLEVRSS